MSAAPREIQEFYGAVQALVGRSGEDDDEKLTSQREEVVNFLGDLYHNYGLIGKGMLFNQCFQDLTDLARIEDSAKIEEEKSVAAQQVAGAVKEILEFLQPNKPGELSKLKKRWGVENDSSYDDMFLKIAEKTKAIFDKARPHLQEECPHACDEIERLYETVMNGLEGQGASRS